MTGEIKVRPGTYFNVQKTGDDRLAGAVNGVTAVLFQADWGPLGETVEISYGDGYADVYGTSLTTDAIKEVFAGGAVTALCCRIGTGGTAAFINLSADDTDAVSLTAKYPGAKAFSVTLRDKLSDDTKRECIIFSGTKIVESVEFSKTEADEVAALIKGFENSSNFIAGKMEGAAGKLNNVMQAAFTAGTNPDVTVEDYSTGLSAVEMYDFNTICIDTEESAVHNLLAAFIDRIYQAGQLAMAVVAEKSSVSLTNRMQNAAAFNSEKMHYVLNGNVLVGEKKMEGYQTAARLAGMIGSCPANKSLTHVVMEGSTSLNEKLTPTQISKAETMGCIVFSMNDKKQVWIDNAINTLITPSENQDEGWKKIRRTKTRYELISRANRQADSLVGKVDNDANGRATIVSQIQGIGTAMVEEGKLLYCKVSENGQYKADGDSAWFDIEITDKDSAEHIYLTYNFRFSTQTE